MEQLLLAWFHEHGRDLPWRRTRDPYSIFVSEVMLQQTQVERVVPRYLRWLERWPTAQALAALAVDFNNAYAAIFGLAFDDRAVEIVAWKVEVRGPIPGAGSTYRLKQAPRAPQALRAHRQAYFPEAGGFAKCAVYDRYAFVPGQTIEGPALIEEAESTCVLGGGDRAFVDEHLNLVIDIEELRG